MVDLFCTPFVDLIDRMRLEHGNRASIFDLPERKWYRPSGDDLAVAFHGQQAGNPIGPASGPQTQMAQNLVLSWLAGSRIMELKTVQVNDKLVIPRPCIDAANIGYNVEWSQELKVHESLDQYVQGAMLIHMLRTAPGEFGIDWGEHDMAGTVGQPVYDMSVGYDLASIQSDKVVGFIRGMLDASPHVQRLRDEIPQRLGTLKTLKYPTVLSRSITLSTFHGCPANEIEKICEHLLTDIGVNVIVKMNPPMLGRERLEHLLHDEMGYTEIAVNPTAYTGGLLFDESIAMCGRLSRLAAEQGLGFGAKFSNTLEVINHRDYFPMEEKVMYLSGIPLHVITLTLAHEFRNAVGPQMPISFSAGIDRSNVANAVACGFVPVTTCTDLLKVGGYGRLPAYFQELHKAMQQCGADNLTDYILDCRGKRDEAGGDPHAASLLNHADIVAETQADDRYHAVNNRGVPRKIGSHLTTFDCITCDKCIPVCPNDANFAYAVPEVDLCYRDLVVNPNGTVDETGEEKRFTLEHAEQIANFADYCNHCGNCDTFCPEYDGPYLKKPSFFGSREAFEAGEPHDGFWLSTADGKLTLTGRIESRDYVLCRGPDRSHTFGDGVIRLLVAADGTFALGHDCNTLADSHTIDMGRYHVMVTLLDGITSPDFVHAVNTPLLASDGEV